MRTVFDRGVDIVDRARPDNNKQAVIMTADNVLSGLAGDDDGLSSA